MESRTEYALRLMSHASFGDPSRPIIVELLGAPVAPSLPTDTWWALRSCLMDSVSTLIGRRQYDWLDLHMIQLDSPALVFQRTVHQGPLRHYLEHSTPYDPTQSDNLPLPVVVRVQGRWLLADGTHRYVADLLMGRPSTVYAVGSKLPCFCSTNRSVRRNPWNTGQGRRTPGTVPTAADTAARENAGRLPIYVAGRGQNVAPVIR